MDQRRLANLFPLSKLYVQSILFPAFPASEQRKVYVFPAFPADFPKSALFPAFPVPVDTLLCLSLSSDVKFDCW